MDATSKLKADTGHAPDAAESVDPISSIPNCIWQSLTTSGTVTVMEELIGVGETLHDSDVRAMAHESAAVRADTLGTTLRTFSHLAQAGARDQMTEKDFQELTKKQLRG
jgi:hypothetical protein